MDLNHKNYRGPFANLYKFCYEKSKSPYGALFLFIIAFCESSFFPIPPDAILIGLCLIYPPRFLYYATLCSIGSVLGGAFGYLIGLKFMDLLGYKIINFYGLWEKYYKVGSLYSKYDFLAVGVAGFTPLPYKLFTISAGAFKINFLNFILASAISRSARFFLVAAVLKIFGERFKVYIERYFNIFALTFGILIVVGFLVLKLF